MLTVALFPGHTGVGNVRLTVSVSSSSPNEDWILCVVVIIIGLHGQDHAQTAFREFDLQFGETNLFIS